MYFKIVIPGDGQTYWNMLYYILNNQKYLVVIKGLVVISMRHKQMDIFERKVYKRILGSVYDNAKGNWMILTNKEIYARVKKPTKPETLRLNRLHWFGQVQIVEENRIPKRVLYIWIWEQDWKVDHKIDDKMKWERMEE